MLSTLKLNSSPHQRVKRDTSQVMRLVIYAMLPGIALQTYFFGYGVLIQCLLAGITAITAEAAVLFIRKKNIERTLSDYSALLTGLLVAVSIPPLLPWWMTVIGVGFAIIVAKQLYGGLGFNMFNPAMIAYVVLLVSFPAAMTMWVPPQSLIYHDVSFIDTLYVIFSQYTQSGYDIQQLRTIADGTTMATPLDAVKTGLSNQQTYSEVLSSSLFNQNAVQSAGVGWAWVSLGYLIGGLALLKLKIISWQIPMSMIGSVAVLSLLFFGIDSDLYASPLFHLLNGSVLIGAFFIATDPVSASTTPRGRLVFGALIGFWIVIIRNFGGYPDAVAFAVLIMNMAVPLIDYYTQPRTYGHKTTSARSKQ